MCIRFADCNDATAFESGGAYVAKTCEIQGLLENNDASADWHSIVEVHHVRVQHADAAV